VWWLSLGHGDALQRSVLHAVAGDGDGFVVKFVRVAGYSRAFDRDERGLSLASAAGPAAARHSPHLIARFDVSGHAAAAETRARGRPLDELLRARLPDSVRLALVDDVAGWCLDVARESATSAPALAAEKARLDRFVVPPAVSWGAPADLVTRLPPVPGVLVHDDLGTWNIVHDGAEFTVVDWESARRPALPLWDLLYFLADALVTVAAPRTESDRVGATLALFRGELSTSPVLFRWVRRAVTALDIPGHAVGVLATLAWLHHAVSPISRSEALGCAGQPRDVEAPALSALARPWLRDPALGTSWSAWC
jgi:hypothetical protein